MSKYLFKVQQKNRIKQTGLLRRFSPDCYGVQSTIEKMREDKAEKHRELKNKRGTKDYDWYFLRYLPSENDTKKVVKKEKKKEKKKENKRQKKKKTRKKGILSRLGFGGKHTLKKRGGNGDTKSSPELLKQLEEKLKILKFQKPLREKELSDFRNKKMSKKKREKVVKEMAAMGVLEDGNIIRELTYMLARLNEKIQKTEEDIGKLEEYKPITEYIRNFVKPVNKDEGIIIEQTDMLLNMRVEPFPRPEYRY